MAFQQFKFPSVLEELGLKYREADLFAAVPSAEVDPAFQQRLLRHASLAVAIYTEKARSEFVIAPVLIELKDSMPDRLGLFSGVELNADANLGLNGVCDFLITKSPSQHLVETPIVAIAEAKNDNPRTGLGQCIAAMVAARMLNRAVPDGPPTVYGVVTSGSLWKFLRLTGDELVLDGVEYHIDNLGKIMGILTHIVKTA